MVFELRREYLLVRASSLVFCSEKSQINNVLLMWTLIWTIVWYSLPWNFLKAHSLRSPATVQYQTTVIYFTSPPLKNSIASFDTLFQQQLNNCCSTNGDDTTFLLSVTLKTSRMMSIQTLTNTPIKIKIKWSCSNHPGSLGQTISPKSEYHRS